MFEWSLGFSSVLCSFRAGSFRGEITRLVNSSDRRNTLAIDVSSPILAINQPIDSLINQHCLHLRASRQVINLNNWSEYLYRCTRVSLVHPWTLLSRSFGNERTRRSSPIRQVNVKSFSANSFERKRRGDCDIRNTFFRVFLARNPDHRRTFYVYKHFNKKINRCVY